VVTRNNYQIVCGTETLKDPMQLFPILRAAIAQTNTAPAKPAAKPSAKPVLHRSATTAHT
jgi:hypothetical protein